MQAAPPGPCGQAPARRLVLLAVAVSLAAAACGTSSARSGSDAVPLRPAGAQGTDATACKPASLDDRVAQVLVVGLPDITDASDPVAQEVLKLGVGGVLLTGGNVVSRSQVTTLVRDLRRQSRHPIVVSTDEETGRVTSFGHLLGASRSARRIAREETPAAMRQEARELASSLSAMGVDLNLAPVADLDDGPYSGIIGDRSFSADPSVTSEFALAFAAGMADGKVRSTAKHFPGHGSATGDDHTGRVTAKATLEDLMATDVAPFGDLIKAGVPVVMMANVDYTALDSDLPASLSPKAYQLLRRMGFTGVAITDSVGMGAVNQRWDVAEAAVAAIKAGADGVLVTDGSMAKHQVRALIQAVNRGVLPEARLNQAAARMTALAGGDPMKFACQPVQLPSLHPTP